ncbi:hypothetical protein [Massilia sp. SYSU DXS3249]
MLTTAGKGLAAQPPLPVMLVQYHVPGNSAEQVERGLTSLVERALAKLHRVVAIHSTTGHGAGDIVVEVEIHFEGGAGRQDLAEVMHRIAQLDFDSEVQPAAVALHLRQPRLG